MKLIRFPGEVYNEKRIHQTQSHSSHAEFKRQRIQKRPNKKSQICAINSSHQTYL
jgi:hypothetical protein